MTTARNIITRALRKNGVLTKNESPSGDEASEALATLNDMISSWSNDSLLIYARQSESFPLVSGQASYTIGSGGDFNTVRPLQILSAFIRVSNIDYDINIIRDVSFDQINQKNILNTYPDVLYYEVGVPLGTITLYPVPTTGALHIRSEKELQEFSTLDSVLELPAGWGRALVYNLSLELAPDYGQQVSQATYEIAMDSLSKIKTAVARNKTMDYPSYGGNYGDINSGWNWWK